MNEIWVKVDGHKILLSSDELRAMARAIKYGITFMSGHFTPEHLAELGKFCDKAEEVTRGDMCIDKSSPKR